MKKLHMELTEVDKKNFNFDLSALNWTHFMDDYAKVSTFNFLTLILSILLILGYQATCLQGGFVNLDYVKKTPQQNVLD